MEIHSQPEAEQAAREASRHFLIDYDPEAQPNLEEGDLFDWQREEGKSIYRFEYVERPRRQGVYLVAVSGMLLHKRVAARPGNEAILYGTRFTCPQGKSSEFRIGLNDPSVVFLGRRLATLVESQRYGYYVTGDGEEAGYGRTGRYNKDGTRMRRR